MATRNPNTPEPRINDLRRDRAVDALRDHMAAGRLSMAEFEIRMDKALVAKTESELTPLFADLPHDPSSVGGVSIWRAPYVERVNYFRIIQRWIMILSPLIIVSVFFGPGWLGWVVAAGFLAAFAGATVASRRFAERELAEKRRRELNR